MTTRAVKGSGAAPGLGRAGAGERGVALVAVILLMLAVTALGHGLLTLAGLERDASGAGAQVLRARVAAEAAVARVASDSGPSDRGDVMLWQRADSVMTDLVDTVPDGDGFDVRVVGRSVGSLRRIGRQRWLAEGRATVGPVRRATAWPLWILDPATLVAETTAALVVADGASTSVEGSLDGGAFGIHPEVEPPIDCEHVLASVDSLRGGALSPPGIGIASGPPRLGPWDVTALTGRIPARVAGRGTPVPVSSGTECRTDLPWNWGDPSGEGSACADHLVAVVGEDGLRVEGGVGQGLLVLKGDGELVDTEFYGVVLAEGRITLSGSTHVRGLIRAGGANVGPLARVDSSACWGAAALVHASLRVPVPLARSGWLHAR